MSQDWQSLHRDEIRGYEILGQEHDDGQWTVEVRFDQAIEPKRDERLAADRAEAVKIGQEIVLATL